jgi:hypothetical protein
MKTSKFLGILAVVGGVFCAVAYAEPTGALAAIAGMFPFVLIRA